GEDSGNLRTLTRVLGQPLPGMASRSSVRVALDGRAGSRAGLTVLGYDYLWAGLERGEDGTSAVVAVRALTGVTERTIARLSVEAVIDVASACAADAAPVAELTIDGQTLRIAPGFVASEGQWIGAELALFAAHGYGDEPVTGTFSSFRVDL